MENILKQQTIDVEVYSESLRAEWNNFIERSAINSTFLHSRNFFDHNYLNSLDDSSLIFYKKQQIIAVLPAVVYKFDNRLIFHSHLRATYGGFVISKNVGLAEAIEIVQLTVNFARERGFNEIIIRNPFRIFFSELCDETDYAMWYFGFQIKSRELETAIRVDGNIQDIRSRYHKGTRYSLGKSRNTIKVMVSDDLKEFWELLEVNLRERHGKKPVHDYELFCNLRESVGKENIVFFGAYCDNRLVGGNVLFNFRNMVLHGQYNAVDKNFQHFAPLHAVVDYIIEWSNQRGFKYFNQGMSNEENGRKINYGLFNWKESFGGRSCLRETMYLDL